MKIPFLFKLDLFFFEEGGGRRLETNETEEPRVFYGMEQLLRIGVLTVINEEACRVRDRSLHSLSVLPSNTVRSTARAGEQLKSSILQLGSAPCPWSSALLPVLTPCSYTFIHHLRDPFKNKNVCDVPGGWLPPPLHVTHCRDS